MSIDTSPTELLFAAATCEIKASADVTKVPQIHINAYSGGLMSVPGFGVVVVDLAGLSVPEFVPFLVDHDSKLSGIVGHGIAEKRAGQLLAHGTVPPATKAARQVVELNRDGFKFQASVGIQTAEKEYIPAGTRVVVNGRNIVSPEGGFRIVRRGELKEISIVALGSDGETSVSIAAQYRKSYPMSTEHDEHDGNTNPNPVADMRAQAAEETRRIGAIQTLRASGHTDLQAQGIEEGWTAERTEVEIFRASMADGPNIQVNGGRGGMTADTLEASLLLRAGAEKVAIEAFGEKAVQQADDLRIDSMPDLCKASLSLAGIEEPRGRDAMLKAAFSTTSLPGLLGNAANKVLVEAYRTFPSVAKQIAKKLTANDFKSHTGHRLTGDATMVQVAPTGEITHGQLSESSYPYSINTYARMFGITRTDIINDDLSAFDEVPKIIARGSSLKLEETFWTLVLANTSAFFSAANGNFIEGALTALDADSLATGVETMRKLVDTNGNPIAVEPKWLVVPPELEATADGLHASLNLIVAGVTDTKIPATNVQGGKYAPLVTPYLSNSNFSGFSATAWYLFGPSSDVASFGIAYLDNRELPTIETQDAAFDTLGVEMRGYFDFGVTQIDSNGGIKSKGAA